MAQLKKIDKAIDALFRYREIGPDPSFSRYIPMVYESIEFKWQEEFEPEFIQLFNGFMLKGEEEVRRIFLAVFPTDDVLSRFIAESHPGDFLFMHHPIVMECGDPRGEWGKGFVPINPNLIKQMKEKRLSVFTLHVPLDYSRIISTSDAMAVAIGAKVIGEIFKDEKGACGVICEIPAVSTEELIEKSKKIFHIPYADVEGPHHSSITKIAIVAGCGDKVYVMEEAEKNGAQAYLTGEIHCHINSDYGKKKFEEMKEYCVSTPMSLIGVSHAASEYLVHATHMKLWFEENFELPVTLIPQETWWV